MRVLALDYGEARCGCALSDPSGTIVTPIEAIPRVDTRRGMAALEALIEEREVERIVVGLPVSLRGGDTAQTLACRAFARRLAARLGQRTPVELHDERFTTRIAREERGTFRAGLDSRAAAHLLESWLQARAARQSASSDA
ncbi:MAG TPA: Holliday junction resolvase RuvX [Solirubrobacteraceae bacterium]|nr:Holliday junction resolvase RuvX [Solirubrobacteraceae bacterium]